MEKDFWKTFDLDKFFADLEEIKKHAMADARETGTFCAKYCQYCGNSLPQ